MRSIKQIIPAKRVNMGGIMLDQPLPYGEIEQIDPFLLVHHWDDKLDGGKKQQDLGVGPHPHRGFAPVTLIFKGGVHHQDSRGNNSVVTAGGVQWMHSGMGIVHSERPIKKLAENGGEFELIQFWVNTPAEFKMEEPFYIPLQQNDITTIISKDGLIKQHLVAGKLKDKESKVKTYTKMLVLTLEIEKGGETEIPVPDTFNAFIYQLDGKLLLNNTRETQAKDLCWFKNDGDFIKIKGIERTRAILLAGEPINEEVSSYGPFVMNTQTEIMKAMRDYEIGKMGVLIEKFD
ncbi:MAG: pirin family protein [Bacteroidetes bacterium]|nr:MAG: pirin family protein [Bacteroidota bacterium]RLD75113.1 MAG: pirin family protein [Bacteroidota bacterium]